MGKALKRSRSITQKRFTPKTLKPQHTRKLIRRFHVLLKAKAGILKKLQLPEKYDNMVDHKVYEQGKKEGQEGKGQTGTVIKIDTSSNTELVRILGQIDGEIVKNGGLEVYQIASQQGQSTKRGSDSSKKLVEWLKQGYDLTPPLTAFEIGCLSPDNVISTSKIFESIHRIDLHSQHHLIQEQNFMECPLPSSEDAKYNVVSCSLVLNFVTTAEERGQMLRRITEFLTNPSTPKSNSKESTPTVSALFLVLPLPCVSNSRYLDDDRLEGIMQVLGFTKKYHHRSSKLVYWLFDWSGKVGDTRMKKVELHKGANRNNFAITLT